MPSEQPESSIGSNIFSRIILATVVWGFAALALSPSKPTTADSNGAGNATCSSVNSATPGPARTIVDDTNAVPTPDNAKTTPAPSRGKARPSRKYRDSNGDIIDERVAEGKLQELQDSVNAMPDGRKRDSYRQALRICEDEWDRIKRSGPIE